MATNPSGRRPE